MVAAQFGVVTRAQLLAAGVGSKGISLRVRDGRLHRLHPGVYAVGHTVLVPKGRTRRLDPEDITTIDGIRVTTIARTILDLAEVLNLRQLTTRIDRAEALKVFDLAELEATIARNPGPKTTTLREALGAEAPSERELQRRFLRLCRRHGLPEPQQEAPIGAYRADFYWPASRLVVETDGRAHHERRAAFERDRQRDLDVAALGIQTLRVTWRMVTRREPELARTLKAGTFASI